MRWREAKKRGGLQSAQGQDQAPEDGRSAVLIAAAWPQAKPTTDLRSPTAAEYVRRVQHGAVPAARLPEPAERAEDESRR